MRSMLLHPRTDMCGAEMSVQRPVLAAERRLMPAACPGPRPDVREFPEVVFVWHPLGGGSATVKRQANEYVILVSRNVLCCACKVCSPSSNLCAPGWSICLYSCRCRAATRRTCTKGCMRLCGGREQMLEQAYARQTAGLIFFRIRDDLFQKIV